MELLSDWPPWYLEMAAMPFAIFLIGILYIVTQIVIFGAWEIYRNYTPRRRKPDFPPDWRPPHGD